MKTLPCIYVVMMCFSIFVSKSSAKKCLVFFGNNFGDGTQLKISFEDATPNQPRISRRSFPSRLVEPSKTTLIMFDVEDGVEQERFLYKSIIKWTEPNGKVIIQTFVAFDNYARPPIPDVSYDDDENRASFFWSLRRDGRFLVDVRRNEIHKGVWSTLTGRVWEVRLTNRREDQREIEIVSMEDPERRSELPSITREKLKFGKTKGLDFNEDDRQIHYVCTVKWKGDDQMEIVKSFVLFFNSLQGQDSTQSTVVTTHPLRIIYRLKNRGVYEQYKEDPKVLWSINEPRPSSNPHP